MQWGPCPAFMPAGCGLAVLHGDPGKANADVFLKLPAGGAVADHWHTSAERMVLVAGELHVTYKGQEKVVFKPGMYAYGPARLPHTAPAPEPLPASCSSRSKPRSTRSPPAVPSSTRSGGSSHAVQAAEVERSAFPSRRPIVQKRSARTQPTTAKLAPYSVVRYAVTSVSQRGRLQDALEPVARGMEECRGPEAAGSHAQPRVREAGSHHEDGEARVRVPERNVRAMEGEDRRVDRVVPRRPDEADDQARPGEAHEGMQAWHEKAPPADFLARRADESSQRQRDERHRGEPDWPAQGGRHSAPGDRLDELASFERIQPRPDDQVREQAAASAMP